MVAMEHQDSGSLSGKALIGGSLTNNSLAYRTAHKPGIMELVVKPGTNKRVAVCPSFPLWDLIYTCYIY